MPLPCRLTLLPLILSIAAGTAASAQDPFEIEVYEYETVAPHAWELEAHANFTADGSEVADGTVVPSERQLHFTVEVTRGLTSFADVAGYVLTAYRPGGGVGVAGVRGRARVRTPDAWHLPVGLGFNAEFSAMRRIFNHSSAILEFAPSIEKRFGRVQLNANVAVGRDLNGPETGAGWELEPSARMGIDVSKRVTLTAEYFGGLGHLWRLDPLAEQVHQFYPGVELRLGNDLHLSAGVGIGVTDAGNRLVFKTSFELPLGESYEDAERAH